MLWRLLCCVLWLLQYPFVFLIALLVLVMSVWLGGLDLCSIVCLWAFFL